MRKVLYTKISIFSEMGLTNRQLLLALPFGGIMEIPKAFLDPRRSVDPTPEMREEGTLL